MVVRLAGSIPGEIVECDLGDVDQPWTELARVGRALTGITRVVVVRGWQAFARAGGAAVADEYGAALAWLARPDLVSVAAIDADVAGPALAAALACDLRVARADAVLCCARDGDAAPAAVAMSRLVALVGRSRALELALTGRRLHAREAAAWGLVNLVVGADELDAALNDLLEALLATPHLATTEVKALAAEPPR